jgi:hypothetical protein
MIAVLMPAATTGCASGGESSEAVVDPSSAASAPASPLASPPASPPPANPSSAPAPTRWSPPVGTAWQWQLTVPIDTSVNVPVYDIDGFENGADVVADLHRRGRRVICYLNAGAYEDFRPDRDAFPKNALGKGNGWRGERWLDVRRIAELRPIMAKRMDMCRDKGFDAVEPDLLDAVINDTGFPTSGADQLAYNRMIAQLAHERGLGVALKNDLEQIPDLVHDFDFAVNEECAQFRECERLKPFIDAHKAVLHVEYELALDTFCTGTTALGLSSMRKEPDLGPARTAC